MDDTISIKVLEFTNNHKCPICKKQTISYVEENNIHCVKCSTHDHYLIKLSIIDSNINLISKTFKYEVISSSDLPFSIGDDTLSLEVIFNIENEITDLIYTMGDGTISYFSFTEYELNMFGDWNKCFEKLTAQNRFLAFA